MTLTDYINQLVLGARDYNLVIAIILVLTGATSCFLGRRMLKITQAIQGYLLGFVTVCMVSFYYNVFDQVAVLEMAFWGGFIGLALMLMLSSVAVFIMGGITGLFLAIAGEITFVGKLDLSVAIVGLVLGVVLSILLDQIAIPVTTAVGGSWGLIAGVALLVGMGWFNPLRIVLNPEEGLTNLLTLSAAWVLLTTAGLFFQYKVFKKTVALEPLSEGQSDQTQEVVPTSLAVKLDTGIMDVIKSETANQETKLASAVVEKPVDANEQLVENSVSGMSEMGHDGDVLQPAVKPFNTTMATEEGDVGLPTIDPFTTEPEQGPVDNHKPSVDPFTIGAEQIENEGPLPTVNPFVTGEGEIGNEVEPKPTVLPFSTRPD
jgi:hypothetical protein